MTSTIPHDPYIQAVADALTEAKMEPAEVDVRDSETCINYLMLDAVITLTPEDSGIPDRFEHGLILIWEHHDNHGDECDDEGAFWKWAKLVDEHGQSTLPEPLPVPGFVAPEMLAATVATLVHTGKPTLMGSLWHDHLRKPVEAAIEAWGAES